jgi:hypothetical protein
MNASAAAIAADLGDILKIAFSKGLSIGGTTLGENPLINYSGQGNHPNMPEIEPRPAYALTVRIRACLAPGTARFELQKIKFRNIKLFFDGFDCAQAETQTRLEIKKSQFELYRPVYVTPCVPPSIPAEGCSIDTSKCESYMSNSILALRAMNRTVIDRSGFYRLARAPLEGKPDHIGNVLVLAGVSKLTIKNSHIYGRITTGINLVPTADSSGKILTPTQNTIESTSIQRTQDAWGEGEDHAIYAWGFDGLKVTGNQISGFSPCASGYAKFRNARNLLIEKNQFYGSGVALYTYKISSNPSWEIFENITVRKNTVTLAVGENGQHIACGTSPVPVVRQCMSDRNLPLEQTDNSIYYWSNLPSGKTPEKSLSLSENRFQGGLRIMSVTDQSQWSLLNNTPMNGGSIQCPMKPTDRLPDLSSRISPPPAPCN